MKRLIALLAALCLLSGCAAPAADPAPETPHGADPAPVQAEDPAPVQAEDPAPVQAETTAPAQTEAPGDAPVLVCGTDVMTSGQFQYYFGRQYAAVLDAYGDSAFDPSKDLSAQRYDETQTWAEFLTDQALALAEQTRMLCLAADAAGFAPVEGAPLTDADARDRGYADAGAMLTAVYGEGAEPEGYAAFSRETATAAAYSEALREKDYSEDELSAYYDAHAEDYESVFHIAKDDRRTMDVRIIRFYPDDPASEADWQNAEDRARAVEAAFAADPTDSAFAALADAKTEDFKAPGGGLYTGLYPGGTGTLAEWLYPDGGSRAAGDSALLRESDAWALCYVSALGDRPYWQIVCAEDLRREDYVRTLDELRETWVFERHPENIDLRVPTAHNAERYDGVEAVG